jgi:NADH-quinone oxidoreductase subunit L
MLNPLTLLAFGALFSGMIGYHALGMASHENSFWQAAIAHNDILEKAHHVPGWVPVLPLLVALSGIALAWVFYIVNPMLPVKLAKRFPYLYKFLLNKWYFDELYDAVFVRPLKRFGQFLWKFFDEKIIDGLGPNGAALLTYLAAGRTAKLQTGYVYHYAFAMLLGLVVLVSWVVVGGK